MPTHPKTLELYQKAGHDYHLDAEDKAYKIFLSKIYDPDDPERKDISKAQEEVCHSIYRIQDYDKNEWIAYLGHFVGYDGLGNRLTHPTSAKGLQHTYIHPEFRKIRFFDQKTQRFKDRITDVLSERTVYEKKFSQKAVEELMKKRDPTTPNRTIGLIVYRDYTGDIGSRLHPIAVPSFDDFVNKPFDELCRIKKYDAKE